MLCRLVKSLANHSYHNFFSLLLTFCSFFFSLFSVCIRHILNVYINNPFTLFGIYFKRFAATFWEQFHFHRNLLYRYTRYVFYVAVGATNANCYCFLSLSLSLCLQHYVMKKSTSYRFHMNNRGGFLYALSSKSYIFTTFSAVPLFSEGRSQGKKVW